MVVNMISVFLIQIAKVIRNDKFVMLQENIFLKYKKKWFYYLLFCFMSPAGADTAYVGQGFVSGSSVSKTVKTTSAGGNTTKIAPWLQGFSIDDNANFSCLDSRLSSPRVSLVTTSDGYTGYPIADDIIILIRNATAKGTAIASYVSFTSSNRETRESLGIWDARGKATITPSGSAEGASWCSSPFAPDSVYYQTVDGSAGSASFNGDVGIWVGPNAKPGTYKVPTLYFKKGNLNELYIVSVVLYPGRNLTIMAPLNCTITPPPSIVDFGEINVADISTSNQLLAFKKGNLAVNCTGSSKVTMNVSFSGDYSSTPRDLLLKNSDNLTSPATIRGRYTENSSGTCATHSSEDVFFDNTVTYSLNNVGEGTITIPLTWSLCSAASGALGKGTAKATVKIDW